MSYLIEPKATVELSESEKSRSITSLENQVGRRVFWKGPIFFKLCPV